MTRPRIPNFIKFGWTAAWRQYGEMYTSRTFYYLRAVGRKVLWSSACVCLCVCVSVRTVFVRNISQERVHGSPANLVVGAGGEPLEQVQFWC